MKASRIAGSSALLPEQPDAVILAMGPARARDGAGNVRSPDTLSGSGAVEEEPVNEVTQMRTIFFLAITFLGESHISRGGLRRLVDRQSEA
jgi:hypothetical protein